MPEQSQKKQTVLGFDYGLRQIGIALLQRPLEFATPLCVLRSKNNKPNWLEIEATIKEWQPDKCIVGLPINMDGSESELSKQCRRFARQLDGRLGHSLNFSVSLQDERLSSIEAKEMLAEHGGRPDYHSRPADSLAAKIILERWLAENL